jgi:hypothetical protein
MSTKLFLVTPNGHNSRSFLKLKNPENTKTLPFSYRTWKVFFKVCVQVRHV